MAVDQPIRMGDYVRVGSGEEGIVEKIGWRSTRLRMMQNSLVIIPNAKLAMSTIVNFHLPQPDMTIQIPMTVAYGTDLDRAASIALEVAREVVSSVPGGVPSPEPSLRYGRFGDAGIELNLAVCVAQYTDQFFIRHETIVRLDRRFREAGIVIPYPVREVRLGTEERELLGGGLPAARPGP
jgi:small-conductance mechanosensitive channel